MGDREAQAFRDVLELVERRGVSISNRPTQVRPSYCSSGTSTQPPTPEDLDSPREKLARLYHQLHNTKPYRQFEHQVSRERQRLSDAFEKTGRHPFLDTSDYAKSAEYSVKLRWQTQGIWPKQAHAMPGESWLHEQPLEALGGERDMDPGEAFQLGLQSEASRPYRQFLEQISQEEVFILDGTRDDCSEIRDVAKSAFEAVKRDWTASGIWDSEWGEIPGIKWKHEWPHFWDSNWAEVPGRALEHETPQGPEATAQDRAPPPNQEPNEPRLVSKDSLSPASPPIELSKPIQNVSTKSLFRKRQPPRKRTRASITATRHPTLPPSVAVIDWALPRVRRSPRMPQEARLIGRLFIEYYTDPWNTQITCLAYALSISF